MAYSYMKLKRSSLLVLPAILYLGKNLDSRNCGKMLVFNLPAILNREYSGVRESAHTGSQEQTVRY